MSVGTTWVGVNAVGRGQGMGRARESAEREGMGGGVMGVEEEGQVKDNCIGLPGEG